MQEQDPASHGATWLLEKSQIRERSFASRAPGLRSLLARAAEAISGLFARWYVQSLQFQQNEFNQLVARQLLEHDDWYLAHDQEQSVLLREMALLTARLGQLEEALSQMETRVTHLERLHEPDH